MRWSRRETSSEGSGGSWLCVLLAGEISMVANPAQNPCSSLVKDLDVFSNSGRFRILAATHDERGSAQDLFQNVDDPDRPPWASVAFPLYRVYWAPRPSSGQVSRLRICPTEAMVELYLDRLGDVLGRYVCMHRWCRQICPEIWTSKDRQLRWAEIDP